MIKTRVTKKQVINGFTTIIRLSYCSAQFLLRYCTPIYYTYSNIYGWRSDIYIISDNIAISTGYAPFGNISPAYDIVKDYDDRARAVCETVRNYDDRRAVINSYLSEFIKKVTTTI